MPVRNRITVLARFVNSSCLGHGLFAYVPDSEGNEKLKAKASEPIRKSLGATGQKPLLASCQKLSSAIPCLRGIFNSLDLV